jgi:hypothetical protein
MEYMVFSGSDIFKFTTQMNKFFEEGWIPQGGISVVSDAIGTRFFQAMVKIK